MVFPHWSCYGNGPRKLPDEKVSREAEGKVSPFEYGRVEHDQCGRANRVAKRHRNGFQDQGLARMGHRISVNGTGHSGELTALKGAWFVREGAAGQRACKGNALAVYFTFFVKIAPTGRIIWRLREKDGHRPAEEAVTPLSQGGSPPNG